MSKASTKNYDNAQAQYESLVNQYEGKIKDLERTTSENVGKDAYKENYKEASDVARKNAQKTQQEKYQMYVSQGMNPTRAMKMASRDASDSYDNEKDNLVNNLYNAQKDTVNAQQNNLSNYQTRVGMESSNLENAKNKDNVENQNKGRTWSTVGGILQGTGQMASAVSDENTKDIKEDFDFYIELLRGEK